MNLEMETVNAMKVREEYKKSLEKKFANDPRKIRVYVDEEENRYYIDTFAAHSLGLIDYQTACHDMDRGKNLHEISLDLLETIKKVFKDRIVYIILETKKRNNPLGSYGSDNNDKDIEELNSHDDLDLVGIDVNNAYQDYLKTGKYEDYVNVLSEYDLGESNNQEGGFKL